MLFCERNVLDLKGHFAYLSSSSSSLSLSLSLSLSFFQDAILMCLRAEKKRTKRKKEQSQQRLNMWIDAKGVNQCLWYCCKHE